PSEIRSSHSVLRRSPIHSGPGVSITSSARASSVGGTSRPASWSGEAFDQAKLHRILANAEDGDRRGCGLCRERGRRVGSCGNHAEAACAEPSLPLHRPRAPEKHCFAKSNPIAVTSPMDGSHSLLIRSQQFGNAVKTMTL